MSPSFLLLSMSWRSSSSRDDPLDSPSHHCRHSSSIFLIKDISHLSLEPHFYKILFLLEIIPFLCYVKKKPLSIVLEHGRCQVKLLFSLILLWPLQPLKQHFLPRFPFFLFQLSAWIQGNNSLYLSVR